jgi:hypothetical protein
MKKTDNIERVLIAVIAILVIAVIVVELIPMPVVTGVSTTTTTSVTAPSLNSGTTARVYVVRPLDTATLATVNVK